MKTDIDLQMFAEDEPQAKEPEKTYTDEEVNAIVERKMAEWQKKRDKAKKEEDEAQKLKDMTDQQRADHELQELKAELGRLKAKDAQSEMLKTARSILAEKEIAVSDDLVSLLVSGDAGKTSEAVNAFADMYLEAVKQGVKDALKSETPKTGSKSKGLTKEDIMKVTNRAERQKLINENIELFQ